jgi:hypothetical protein
MKYILYIIQYRFDYVKEAFDIIKLLKLSNDNSYLNILITFYSIVFQNEIYIIYYTIYILLHVLYNVQSITCIIQFTFYYMYYTIYILLHVLYNLQYITCIIRTIYYTYFIMSKKPLT